MSSNGVILCAFVCLQPPEAQVSYNYFIRPWYPNPIVYDPLTEM